MNTNKDYMQTGLNWIDKIPATWSLKKLKFIGTATIGIIYEPKDISDENSGTLVLRASNIQNSKLSLDENIYINKQYNDKYKLKKDDILICSRSGSKSLIGKNILVQDSAIINKYFGAFMTVYRSPQNEYIHKVLQSNIFDYQVELYSTTTINQLTIETLNNIYIPIPNDKQTQCAIASYLEYKINLINELIQKNEKLITLLEEHRTALINQAVTKGLDPNVEMKESGIEWIGNIQANNNIVRLKFLIKDLGSGVTPKGASDVYTNEGVIFIRSQNVQFEGLDLDDVAHIPEKIHLEMYNSRVQARDVLLNITGASLGRCCVVPDNIKEANVNQHVCKLTVNKQVIPEYLSYFLQSEIGQFQIYSLQNGISREGLNYQQIKQIIVPLPKIEEQQNIIDQLNKLNNKIIKIIKAIRNQNTLIQEYRQSLISHAVTGKIAL